MKTNLTNSEFQSKYLPIIQKAETEIKKLVLYYALRLKSKIALQNKIKYYGYKGINLDNIKIEQLKNKGFSKKDIVTILVTLYGFNKNEIYNKI